MRDEGGMKRKWVNMGIGIRIGLGLGLGLGKEICMGIDVARDVVLKY